MVDLIGSQANMTEVFLSEGFQQGEIKDFYVVPSVELGQLRSIHLYTDGGDGWHLKSVSVEKKDYPMLTIQVDQWLSGNLNRTAWISG